MKSLIFSGLMFVLLAASCSPVDIVAPSASEGETTLDLRSGCEPDQEYVDGLKTFLANHYSVAESAVAVAYGGQNQEGDFEFPFTITTNPDDTTGDYIVDDLCLAYSSNFIVEEDVIGI